MQKSTFHLLLTATVLFVVENVETTRGVPRSNFAKESILTRNRLRGIDAYKNSGSALKREVQRRAVLFSASNLFC